MLQLQELSNALDEIEVEPRHDSKLLKIKKALEADYQRNLLENVDKDEVNLLKLYFNRIINEGSNLTITEITSILNKYMEESDNEPYSNIIKQIKVDLTSKKISMDEFFDFIEKFVVQSYPIDIFYKRFFKRSPTPQTSPIKYIGPKPSLTDIFGDELEDLSSSEDEPDEPNEPNEPDEPNEPNEPDEPDEPDEPNEVDEQAKLQKVRERIEEKREEPKTVQIITSQEQPQGKVALIQDNVPIPKPRVPEPKPIADKIFFETMTDLTKQDCEFLYKKIPWVKDIINHIYVHPIDGNFDDVLDFKKFIEHDGVKYYQPKEKYYNIQCRAHKVQEGHELTIVKNKEIYKLMVAVDTNTKGIVLQNEDMLKAEIDYVRVWNQNKNDYIHELKRNEPNDDMILLAKFELSNALVDSISGNVPIAYRSNNSQFINTVVQTILKNSNSGDSFVRLLANIIIFLKINLSFITSSVFIKRLREQIYLPGTLPFLTDADKLPEIFLTKNVPDDTKNFVLEKLEEERLKFTKDFFENIHIGSSMIRKPTKPILWNKPTQQIELPDIKTICKNRDEVEQENDEDIVFYTDLDEVYCFNVFKLYDLFKKEEIPINPYTNRPFSDKFIQIFLTRYASKPLTKKIERTQHTDLTSKLEHLIEKELSMLENNLIETENPEFIERFKSSISPMNNKQNNKVQSKDTFQPRNDNTDNDKKEPEKCMECKGSLGTDKIGSVFRNKEVAFCGYDCLEKNKAFK
jgi:hypothetical protein